MAKKPVVLKIPNDTGEVTTKFGTLCRPPEVKGDVLYAGKVVLVKRGWDGSGNTRGATIIFDQGPNDEELMEVRHEDESATYKLVPDKLVWSDGPPHPDDLQLAVRIRRTDGVEEPGLSQVASSPIN